MVTLCSKCHDKIDRNEVIVEGWEDTVKGRTLKWKLGNKISQKKYNDEDVNIVSGLKDKNYSLKNAKKFLKTNHNIKISTSTISKIWKIIINNFLFYQCIYKMKNYAKVNFEKV